MDTGFKGFDREPGGTVNSMTTGGRSCYHLTDVTLAYKGWPSGTPMPVLVIIIVAVLAVAAVLGRTRRK